MSSNVQHFLLRIFFSYLRFCLARFVCKFEVSTLEVNVEGKDFRNAVWKLFIVRSLKKWGQAWGWKENCELSKIVLVIFNSIPSVHRDQRWKKNRCKSFLHYIEKVFFFFFLWYYLQRVLILGFAPASTWLEILFSKIFTLHIFF